MYSCVKKKQKELSLLRFARIKEQIYVLYPYSCVRKKSAHSQTRLFHSKLLLLYNIRNIQLIPFFDTENVRDVKRKIRCPISLGIKSRSLSTNSLTSLTMQTYISATEWWWSGQQKQLFQNESSNDYVLFEMKTIMIRHEVLHPGIHHTIHSSKYSLPERNLWFNQMSTTSKKPNKIHLRWE